MNYPTLDLDDIYFPSVLSNSITATIRIGDRPIEPGGLVFKSPLATYLPLVVGVEHVIKTTFLGISDYDAQLAGYRDGEHAREEMRHIYPEAQLDTPFTIIRFSRGV